MFRTARSPFDEFSAVKANNSLELEVEALSFEEYSELVEWRFKEAEKVVQAVFYGRANDQPPSPMVFPVIADLANTLGIHFGQQYALSYFV